MWKVSGSVQIDVIKDEIDKFLKYFEYDQKTYFIENRVMQCSEK